MGTDPLEWLELEPEEGEDAPPHPAWALYGEQPTHYRAYDLAGRQLDVWRVGDGTAQHPFFLLIDVGARWPTIGEIRSALVNLTIEGAIFAIADLGVLVAQPNGPFPITLQQSLAVPGSPAAKRLELTGGVRAGPAGQAGAGASHTIPPAGHHHRKGKHG